MKSVQYLAALCVIGSVSIARADVFLDFETLSTAYNADYGAPGGDILGNYSPYVSFGQNVQGTGGTTSLPVIGNVGIENVFDGLFTTTGPATINFQLTGALSSKNAGVSGISFWYSSVAALTISAYDANNVLVATGTAPSNSNGYNPGAPGTVPSLFSLNGSGIEYVVIGDNTGFGGNFVVDDLTIHSSSVPDASGTLGLLGLAGIGLLAFRRQFVAA